VSLLSPLRRYSLTSDLRIQLFARVFAVGTIAHELEFLLEQARIGPLTQYMELWSRVIPSVGWSSRTGLALHFANVAISLLILILPWSRELVCLLAGTFLFSELASPARIASHCSLMAGGLLVVLILGVAEWTERIARRRGPAIAPAEWYAWTLVGLRWVCALTYFFAFFYKLNPNWFSPESRAPAFLISPLEPLLDLLGVPDGYHLLLTPVAIYGTLLVELSLPILLLARRTRLPGGLMGLVFSAGMIAQGVSDFPVLIVAFYAAFLSLAQARELVDRCLARPTIARLVATAAFSAIWFTQQRRRANWMYAHSNLPGPLMAIYASLAFVCFVGMIYVAVTMVAWLLERSVKVHAESSSAKDRRAESSRVVAGSPPRRAVGMVAAAAVFLVSAALAYDHLAGFFALPAAGPLIMFSGISADLSNHLFLRRTALSTSFDYVSVVRFESSDSNSPAAREFRSFARWLRQQRPPYEVNLNEVRYQMSRVCDAPAKPTVQLTLRTRGGESLDYKDVCATPAILWYAPLQIVSACSPECNDELALRASGGASEMSEIMKAAPDFLRRRNLRLQTDAQ
jgi:hypothetical protein